MQSENESEEIQSQKTFAELGLSEGILKTLADIGFSHPTTVQAEAIPPALEGRDLLVQSRTGSGKTAAFGIPLGEILASSSLPKPQALVLAPTRELALQVEKECSRLLAHAPVESVAIYGGAAIGPQIKALEDGAQLVVGTPGRVLDHMRRGTLKTDDIRFFVLDEADEMLSMGFWEEITAIVESLPKKRQNMLFSATIPQEIEGIAEAHLADPIRLYLSEDFVGVREIDHVYYMVSGGNKTRDLLAVLEYEKPALALIFCNTREETARVANFLSDSGFASEGISSDLSQRDRERVMKRMRAGELKYLVATDIAARGIDINDVSHVVNYSFPDSPDVYVHRTGRTGRAGKSGIAVSSSPRAKSVAFTISS
jgi:ATP-dependent RNA helicase DeaD